MEREGGINEGQGANVPEAAGVAGTAAEACESGVAAASNEGARVSSEPHDAGRARCAGESDEGAAGDAAPSAADAEAAAVAERRAPCGNNLFLMGICAAAACVMGALVVFANSYDNDVWFLMATGREIVEHGIPHVNPFAIHEGLGFVVQQWVVCAWLYLLYSAGGFVATGLWTLALFGAFVLSAYKVGRLLRGNAHGGEWVFLVLLVVTYSMTFYMTVRPHLYSMLAFLWIVFFLEKYRASFGGETASRADALRGAWKWLVPIPFIVAVHGNVQAAIAPFDLVIIGCYLIPDVLRPFHARGRLEGVMLADAAYARVPLAALLVVAAAALLANPYFIDGALYLINSYGSAEYAGYISEMSDFAPAGSIRFALVLVVLLVACVCLGRVGARRINLPLVLLVAGTTYMAFDHVRNIWLCTLFCYLLIMWSTSDVAIGWPRRLARREMACVVPVIAGIAIACVVAFVNVPKLQGLPANNAFTPVSAMDYLDERDVDKQQTRVFTFFNAGGYIEWRGYKVNMDPRPEIWAPRITGDAFDYYKEYVDMSQGSIVFNLYKDKYDFDVFILPSDEPALEILKNDWNYVRLPSGDDYAAYAKRSLVSREASDVGEIELPAE